jgi:hypothetical protein
MSEMMGETISNFLTFLKETLTPNQFENFIKKYVVGENVVKTNFGLFEIFANETDDMELFKETVNRLLLIDNKHRFYENILCRIVENLWEERNERDEEKILFILRTQPEILTMLSISIISDFLEDNTYFQIIMDNVDLLDSATKVEISALLCEKIRGSSDQRYYLEVFLGSFDS